MVRGVFSWGSDAYQPWMKGYEALKLKIMILVGFSSTLSYLWRDYLRGLLVIRR
jgi:hypothetical protein